MLMDKNVKHREIRVSTLWYRILKQWRVLLIAGLIFAVLGAGYKYAGMAAANASAREEAVDTQDAQETGNADEQSAAFDEIITRSQQQMQDVQSYLGETILGKIDPSSEPVASATYVIMQQSDAASAAYSPDYAAQEMSRALQNDLDWEAIAKTQNTKSQYIYELVDFDVIAAESDSESSNEGSNESKTTPMIMVTVKHYDMEAAQEIRDAIDAQVQELFTGLNVSDYYTITLKDTAEQYVVDGSLLSWTNSRLNELTSLKSNIERLQSEKDQYTSCTASSAVILSSSDMAKGCLKYAAVGFVGGVVLMMLLMAFYMAVCGRVLSAEELNRVFGLRLLTVMPEKKQHRTAFDRAVARLDADGRNELTEEESYQLAVQNLLAFYEGREGSILLTGDVPEDLLQHVMEQLQSELKETRLQFACCTAINRHPAAIKQLQGSDAVILVEKIGASHYKNAAADVEIIENHNKLIIGSIVL